MAAELILTPEFEQDFAEAYDWYEDRRFRLGEDFLSYVDSGLQSIVRMPEMFPVVYKGYRQTLVRRFPFMLLFDWRDGVVTVFSVFHTRLAILTNGRSDFHKS